MSHGLLFYDLQEWVYSCAVPFQNGFYFKNEKTSNKPSAFFFFLSGESFGKLRLVSEVRKKPQHPNKHKTKKKQTKKVNHL